ncbi:HAD domain-containing protein [Embleya sp. AB8]|uniref:HAD domain-containing protein n=1 Tax=Embleya sp. AB8 TaxID=3156304 RepID=UPI003C737F88
MTGRARRPLLFLDVDGPLIPFGGDEYPTYPMDPELPEAVANPLLARVDPAHGPRLSGLPCELVWATAWTADANSHIAPRLGLPELAVVYWPEASDRDDRDEREGLHWKTRALVAWASGRPFVWVDDELTDTDRRWVARHHRGAALLHGVDSRSGLTEADFATVDAWLRTTGHGPGHGSGHGLDHGSTRRAS